MLVMQIGLYLIASLCLMVLINKLFSPEKNQNFIESSDRCWVAYGLYKYIILSWDGLGFKSEKFVSNAYILECQSESFQSFCYLMLSYQSLTPCCEPLMNLYKWYSFSRFYGYRVLKHCNKYIMKRPACKG